MTITSMWEWLEAGNRGSMAVDWSFKLMGGAVGVYWDPHRGCDGLISEIGSGSQLSEWWTRTAIKPCAVYLLV